MTAYLTEVVGNGSGLTVKGKDAASGASDNVVVKSGDSALGASGDLQLGTGTAATTAGNVELVPGGSATAAFTDGGGINLAQSSSAPTVGANQGAFWVLNSTVTSPMFTDDLGDDHNLLNWSPVKRPCRLATTANIASINGGAPDTVDSVSVSAGDRILVKDQSTGSQNGIYRVVTVGTGSNGTWFRALDFNDATTDHIEAGVETYIQEGTTHNQTRFTLTTTGTIVLGTTSLTFTAL